MTAKRTLPILSALLDDLDALAAGAKPHPKASKEGDRRVLGIARAELRAAKACLRELEVIQRMRGHSRTGEDRCECSACRALARLDKITRPTQRKP